MVVALMIVTVVFALTADAFIQHHRKMVGEGAAVEPELLGMPADLRAIVLENVARSHREPEIHLHPGHSWAKRASRDIVTVGADELTGRLLGKVDSVSLPAVGERIIQGRRAWSLSRDGRNVDQVAPITGVVAAVNAEVVAHPETVNSAPYKAGWLLKVAPEGWDHERHELFSGSLVGEWMKLSRARILALFGNQGAVGGYATAQDGGELVEGLSEHITDEQWNRLHKDVFRSTARQ